ncbi:MAG: hypothetical protein KGH88_04365 [Thaumarchaeota archaeon]|nr:hypothetical protein [Nitrososphaerota archaeon]
MQKLEHMMLSLDDKLRDDMLKRYSNELQKLEHVLDSYIATKTIPSLNALLGEKMAYFLKKTQEAVITNFESLIPDSEKTSVMSAVYVKCEGDLHIGVLWYVLEEELKPLAEKLLEGYHLNEFDKIAISSISEIGNILTASIVNAIYDDKGCKMWASVPGFATESLNTLLEVVMADFGDQSDTVVISTVEFRGISSGIRLQMLLIQDPKESKRLIS